MRDRGQRFPASDQLVKRIELERWLRSHGAERVPGHSRGGHDAWRDAETGAKSFVPRHREIGTGGRAICRQKLVVRLRADCQLLLRPVTTVTAADVFDSQGVRPATEAEFAEHFGGVPTDDEG